MLQLLLDLFGDVRQGAAGASGASGAPPAPSDSEKNRPLALEPPAQAAIQNVAIVPDIDLAQALPPALFDHPRANRVIRFAHAHVAYELRRGKRRTIGFQVGADGLSVSAPRWTPLGEVEAALRDKERWIVTKLREARDRQARLESARIEWREGAQVPFLGQPVVLVIDPRQRHGRGGAVLVLGDAALPGVPAKALHIGLPQTASAEQLRDTVQAWLMRQAKTLFTERLNHFAPQLQVHWRRMALSNAGTRWGSASADGSIRLNWRLIHTKMAVIDYVVAHELSHLRVMDHSPRFWDTVRTVVPDYAQLRRHLQEEPAPQWN